MQKFFILFSLCGLFCLTNGQLSAQEAKAGYNCLDFSKKIELTGCKAAAKAETAPEAAPTTPAQCQTPCSNPAKAVSSATAPKSCQPAAAACQPAACKDGKVELTNGQMTMCCLPCCAPACCKGDKTEAKVQPVSVATEAVPACGGKPAVSEEKSL